MTECHKLTTVYVYARGLSIFVGAIFGLSQASQLNASNESAPFSLDLRLGFAEWAANEAIPAEAPALLDYALGRRPSAAEQPPFPSLVMDSDLPGFFTFSYTRNPDVVGISVTKEMSSDLNSWVPVTPVADGLVEVLDGGVELREARFERESETSSAFYRIRVNAD